eukprot:7304779-Pyramimonas_sp.AAC.1
MKFSTTNSCGAEGDAISRTASNCRSNICWAMDLRQFRTDMWPPPPELGQSSGCHRQLAEARPQDSSGRPRFPRAFSFHLPGQ